MHIRWRNTVNTLTALCVLSLLTAFGYQTAHAQMSGLTGSGSQMFQEGADGIKGNGAAYLNVPVGDCCASRRRGDFFGHAVAVGDFNGDGYQDLAMGIPDDGAKSESVDKDDSYDKLEGGKGGIVVVYGAVGGLFAGAGPGNQKWTADSPGIPGGEELGDQFGYAVAAGDFNFDHYADLAIGIPGEDGSAGMVTIIYGSPEGLSATAGPGAQNFQQGSDYGIRGTREGDDRFGASLSAADINLDGYADLAVGVPGENVGSHTDAGGVNVIYGTFRGLHPAGNQYFDQNEEGMEGGSEEGDHFGSAVVLADLNGDHYADLAIGIPGEGLNHREGGGAVAIIYASHEQSGLNAYAGPGNQMFDLGDERIPRGVAAKDAFGFSLAAADFNGDGSNDLAIGIPNSHIKADAVSYKKVGAIAVIYSSPGYGLDPAYSLAPSQYIDQDSCDDYGRDYCMEGVTESDDRFGYALAAGDFNRDGYADLAIGVPGEDDVDGDTGGAVAVIYGGDKGLQPANTPHNQLWDQNSPGVAGGLEQGDNLGWSLSAGDFNGDGTADLAIGAPGEDRFTGAVNVMYGTPLDSTPPVLTPRVEGTLGENGWYVSDVQISWDYSDPDSDIYRTEGCEPITVNTDTPYSFFTCKVTSRGGTSQQTVAVKRDATTPVIAGTRSPAANQFGWNNTSVMVNFICSDATSGVADCTPEQVISSEGTGQSRTGTVVDRAGNRATAMISDINIDKTAPTITAVRTPEANQYGWNNTSVTIKYNCGDGLSGVGDCTGEQTLNDEGAGQLRTGMVTDKAGNSASVSVTVNIDKTAPLVSCSISPSVIWPPNNQMIPVAATVLVTDRLSGRVGFKLINVTSNEPVLDYAREFSIGAEDTSGLLRAQRTGNGTGRIYTITYAGEDRAGNAASCQVKVSVPHDRGSNK